MVRAFRNNALKKLMPAIIVLLAAALLLLCLTHFAIFRLLGGASDIEDVPEKDLNGSYVRVKLSDVLTSFVNLKYTAPDGTVSVRYSYCLLCYSEDQYIVLCLDGRYNDVLDGYSEIVTSENAAALLPNISTTFTGGITEIEDEALLGYYLEALHEYGAISSADRSACGANIHFLTVTSNTLAGNSVSRIFAFTLSAAIFILSAAAIFFLCRSGFFFKDARTATAGEDVNSDYEEAKVFDNIRVGKNFVYYTQGLRGYAVRAAKIIWVYPSNKRLEGNKMKWSLVMFDTDKNQHRVYVKDLTVIQQVSDAIEALKNPLITGYDAEKKLLFEKNFSRFYALASQNASSKSDNLTNE